MSVLPCHEIVVPLAAEPSVAAGAPADRDSWHPASTNTRRSVALELLLTCTALMEWTFRCMHASAQPTARCAGWCYRIAPRVASSAQPPPTTQHRGAHARRPFGCELAGRGLGRLSGAAGRPAVAIEPRRSDTRRDSSLPLVLRQPARATGASYRDPCRLFLVLGTSKSHGGWLKSHGGWLKSHAGWLKSHDR